MLMCTSMTMASNPPPLPNALPGVQSSKEGFVIYCPPKRPAGGLKSSSTIATDAPWQHRHRGNRCTMVTNA